MYAMKSLRNNLQIKYGEAKNAPWKQTLHSKNIEIIFQGNNLTDFLLISVS